MKACSTTSLPGSLRGLSMHAASSTSVAVPLRRAWNRPIAAPSASACRSRSAARPLLLPLVLLLLLLLREVVGHATLASSTRRCSVHVLGAESTACWSCRHTSRSVRSGSGVRSLRSCVARSEGLFSWSSAEKAAWTSSGHWRAAIAGGCW